MQANQQMSSEQLPTVAQLVTASGSRPGTDTRRRHRRFVVDGSFVRVQCRSFEVQGATAELQPVGVLGVLYRMFSSPCQILNLSRGGVSLETTVDLPRGRRVLIHLNVPGRAAPLTLIGEVRWRKSSSRGHYHTLGVEFAPFSKRPGCNAPEALYVLRELESSATHAS